MIETLRMSKGKSKPITINNEVRAKIESFKDRLYDESRVDSSTTKAISFILNELEPYECNILLAYYEWGNDAARMLGITPMILLSKVRKILYKIKMNK